MVMTTNGSLSWTDHGPVVSKGASLSVEVLRGEGSFPTTGPHRPSSL